MQYCLASRSRRCRTRYLRCLASGCREQKGLAAEDAKQESRLSAHLFRLLRCGRLHEACRLAGQTCQPWRAMSLAGAGRFGPLPLGAAAAEADADDVQEAVAAQDDLGFGASQALWKWACYQARPALPDLRPACNSCTCMIQMRHEEEATQEMLLGRGTADWKSAWWLHNQDSTIPALSQISS